MQSVHAVIGANYGDEGKGLIVDYLTRKTSAGIVVRHNGGAQAGHTVHLPDGRKHVFHHLSSGTFAGATTYLASEFICNPVLFREEVQALAKMDPLPPILHVAAHPKCRVTTIYDMLVNHAAEYSRSDKRHGSCGVGINETVERCAHPGFDMTMDFLYRATDKEILDFLEFIGKVWVPMRLRELGMPPDSPHAREVTDFVKIGSGNRMFLSDVDFMKALIKLEDYGLLSSGAETTPIIFEGAQGLALDQYNKAEFPHVTRSNTGLLNVMRICEFAQLPKPQVTYVSRTYLTRHGEGVLPDELPPDVVKGAGIEDTTNVDHPFQGSLRFAPLDTERLAARILADVSPYIKKIKTMVMAFTWCDAANFGNNLDSEYEAVLAKDAGMHLWLASYGPTHKDVRELYSRE